MAFQMLAETHALARRHTAEWLASGRGGRNPKDHSAGLGLSGEGLLGAVDDDSLALPTSSSDAGSLHFGFSLEPTWWQDRVSTGE